MAIKCPKCQAENPETVKFCGECGTQFSSSETSRPDVTETLQTPIKELTTGSAFAGRYQIIEELGHGGMGRVYKVLDTKIGEKIALKLIRPEAGLDKKTLERFSNELKLARKIRHKNVCQMFDLGDDQGTRYITMEYVRGEDLKQLVRKVGRLSPAQAIGIARQVCEGLEEAHKLGVIHRDLKPQNIMIDEDGNARIMDFGIARSLAGKSITGSGVMIGTPEYMSPEQVEGKEVDRRSDIYSLGVILYEMVTGRVPFEGDTPFTIGIKHKSEAPKDPRELNAQLPEDLSRLILRCLEKDREKRYESAAGLSGELERIEQGIPTTERAFPVRKAVTSREITVKFTPKKLLIPAAALVVLVTAGLFFLLRPRGPGLEPKRVVVAPFENKTGDPKLDNVGFMASDWISQGLMKTDMVFVSSLPAIDAFKGTQEEKNKIRQIAKATRAGKVVTGAYYLEGETMRFVAEVLDARQGKLLGSVEPVSGPAGEPVRIIESLRQKVLGVLAAVLEAKLPASSRSHIPTYQAYQAYMEGWKAFNRYEYAKSIELCYEAVKFDPDFVLPLGMIGAAYFNLGKLAEMQELVKKVEQERDKLTPFDKINLERGQAILRGDLAGEYQAAKRMYELDPSGYAYNLGWSAVRINRPREAIEVFRTANPESLSVKDWLPFWSFYSGAYHMLGEHNKELKIARQARKSFPDRYDALWLEMRSLAALGKMSDLERLLEESRQFPPQGTWNLARLLISSGQELRVHGYRKELLDFLDRAIQWLKSRPESETKTEVYRSRMANCLYRAERWDEAKADYEALAKEFPENLEYRSLLGIIAARLGNREEAQRISDELGKVERRYLFGSIPYYQARIAALLGEKDKAVKLLQESVAQGEAFYPGGGYHSDMEWELLENYPPFKEFIKPKG